MIKRKSKIILSIVLLIVALCFAAFFIYTADYYRADESAAEALEARNDINIIVNDSMIIFEPQDAAAGLIFYPGGKVEFSAYAPLMEEFAENGVLCVLIKMPFNLAVLNMDAADNIESIYPEVTKWFIGGHSLGGACASGYAAKHPDDFDGLLLLASYSTYDLTMSGLEVVSVYGSEDGVLNLGKYQDCLSNLPFDYTEHVIDGGCHAYFGSYGAQKGDGAPTISGDKQISETVSVCMDVIKAA